ncbi:hypothetical protein BJ944DRAFT_96122 [Cunninghamella echinulata]|nr:hypothetical protein BJ944DRAFT_96122 [Cunninghamella echinulata]
MKYFCFLAICFLINITQGSQCSSEDAPIYSKGCVQGCKDNAGKTSSFLSEVVQVPSDDNCNKCSSTLYNYPDGTTCLEPIICTPMPCPDL